MFSLGNPSWKIESNLMVDLGFGIRLIRITAPHYCVFGLVIQPLQASVLPSVKRDS